MQFLGILPPCVEEKGDDQKGSKPVFLWRERRFDNLSQKTFTREDNFRIIIVRVSSKNSRSALKMHAYLAILRLVKLAS